MAAENTSANSTVSAESINKFERLTNTKARTEEPKDTTIRPTDDDPRFSYVNALKSILPEHAWKDNSYLLFKLRDDEKLRSQTVDKIIEGRLEEDRDFRSQWEEQDEEERQSYRKGLNRNMVKTASKHTYSGETVKQSISDHLNKLSETGDEFRITNPTKIVQNNHDNYTDYFDEDDAKNGEIDQDTVHSLYENDEDFRAHLINDRLEEYEEQLGSKANQGVFDPELNPEQYAQGFAVYNRFGKEALTDFANIYQHYIPGSDEQPTQVDKAFNRFGSSPQYKDSNPFDYASEFVEGKDVLDIDNDDLLSEHKNTIQETADKYGLEHDLFAGLLKHESIRAAEITGEDPETIASSAGAVGLGQLMAATAQDMGLRVDDLVDERKDPEKNIDASGKYLSQLLEQYEGDEERALAAYNAGPTNLKKMEMKAREQGKDHFRDVLGKGFFSETGNYIPSVQKERDNYSSKTKKSDPLTFRPKEEIEKLPKDYNDFTGQFFYTPENKDTTTNQEKTVNFINNMLEWQSGGEYAPFDIGTEKAQPGDDSFLEQDKALNLEDAFYKLSKEYEKRGEKFPKDYSNFAYQVVDQALLDEDGPGLEGLLATLGANAKGFSELEDGQPVWELDYRDLKAPDKQHLKIIADGLKVHGAGDSVVTFEGNKILLEPGKQERRDQARANMEYNPITNPFSDGVPMFEKETRLVMDEGQNVLGTEEVIPNNLTNTMAGFVTGVNDWVPEIFGGVAGNWSRNFFEKMGADEDFLATFDKIRNKNRDFYSGHLGEWTEPVLGPMSMTDLGIAGGNLAGYFAGMAGAGRAIGKAGLKAMGNVGKHSFTLGKMNNLASARKLTNYKNWYHLANKSKSPAATKFRTAMEAVGKGKRWTSPLQYSLGAGAMETVTDPNFSIAVFADHIIQDQIMGLEEDEKYDLEQHYRTTSGLGRWAVDWLGGEMIGILFDGMIGAAKLANDYGPRALRGKPKLGLEYDPKTGKYLPEEESRYFTESNNPLTGTRKYLFPDIQRFVFNTKNNVDNIPIGNIKESAKAYSRRVSPGPQSYDVEEVSSQADVTAKFVQDSNNFMSTFREDLRQVIEDANDKYGGRITLSEEDVTRQVNEIYDEFMDDMARNINKAVGDEDGFNTRTFASQLERHPGVLEDTTPVTVRGKQDLTRNEATIAQKREPNSHVIPIGDDKFRVVKQDPALWRLDLSQRLRQYGAKSKPFDESIDTHLNRFGLDAARDGDLDDVERVIDTLENTKDVSIKHEGREGHINGFDSNGWRVSWDDGSDAVYSEIRGLEGVDRKPPQIKSRNADTDSGGKATEYDEQGFERQVDVDEDLRGSQNQSQGKILDLRNTSQLIDEELGVNRGRMSEDARAKRQEELEELFPDSETQIRQKLDEVKQLMRDGNHEEAEEVIREISRLKGGPDPTNGDVKQLPGIVRLQEIVEQDRAEFESARAERQAAESGEMAQVEEFHRNRLQEGLSGGNLDDARADIQVLRSMGMSKDEMDEFIDANFMGDTSTQQFLKNYNTSLDFAEGTLDELAKARVDAKRMAGINDEAFQALPERIKQQMVEQAEILANTKDVDTPQRLISEGDEEVTGYRSWNTANEAFKENRPKKEGLSNREYSIRLAEELGVDNVKSIGKLQKTRKGGKEKVPIERFDESAVLDEDGNVKKIKNSKGLVVRVDPVDGGMPYYAIGRKNNIKSLPTRFVADQNGKIVYNQEWAFINPNVTIGVDGRLKRFKSYELPNGEMAYRESPNGEFLLNVQNPVRTDFYDYVGRVVKDTMGRKQVQEGTKTHKLLSPENVLKRNIDAIETRDPRTGQTIYKLVAPEDQVLRHGKEVGESTDARSPHIVFETSNQPRNPLEQLPKFSKTEGTANAHAWLAAPGLIFSGTAGVDENGELTPFAKAALAMGTLAMGGVMIRSMTGQFKIRKAYDNLDPKYKEVFDQFDWNHKIKEGGTPRKDLLTDDESAMFNRLQGVPKDDYMMLSRIARHHGYANLRPDEVPEIRGEIDEIRNDEYTNWATFIDRDTGKIHYSTPSSARSTYRNEELTQIREGNRPSYIPEEEYQKVRGRMESYPHLYGEGQPVITLELDKNSQGLVSNSTPAHEFKVMGEDATFVPREGESVTRRADEVHGKSHKVPVSWARTQTAPDGRLLLDELQVDNALQKGQFGKVGDVNRDLYNAVTDEFVAKAIKESDGEFYITRGHMQSARYGDDPSLLPLRKRAREEIFGNATKTKENIQPPVIRDEKAIREAQSIHGDSVVKSEYRVNNLQNEELNKVVEGYAKIVRRLNPESISDTPIYKSIVDDIAKGVDGGTGRHINVESVKNGYKVSLNDDSLVELASRQFYEGNIMAKRSFPEFRDFEQFVKGKTKFGGLINFYDNTLPNVLKKRYGAEVTYAKGDPKKVYDSPEEAFHKVKVTQEGLDAARGKTGKRLNWEMVPGSMAVAGLAASAYGMQEISDRQPPEPEDPMNQAGLGGMSMVLLGAAALGILGSRRVRTKIGGHIKGAAEKSYKNAVDNVSAKSLEMDGKKYDAKEIWDLDMAFDPRDPKDVTKKERMLHGVLKGMRAGKNAMDSFTSNSWVQAGTQLLKRTSDRIKTVTGNRGTTVLDKVNDFILGANSAPSKIMKIANLKFNEDLGYGRGSFESFPEQRGVQAVKDVIDSEVDDAYAKEMFNRSVVRILNRGIQKRNGRGLMGSNIPDNVRAVYESEQGRLFKDMDQKLLNNEEFVDWTMTLQRSYDEVRGDYLQKMNNEINRRLIRLSNQPMEAERYRIGDNVYNHRDLMDLTKKWVRSDKPMTYREFAQSLNPDERHLLRIAKRDSEVFNDLLDIQHTKTRFTDLKGRYHPQIVDHRKLEAVRDRYVNHAEQNPEVLDAYGRDMTPEEYAYIQMKESFQEINGMPGDGRGLISFDPEKLDIGNKEFGDVHEVTKAFRSVINGLPREMQDQFRAYMGAELTPENLQRSGFVDEITNSKGEQKFVLREPDDFNPKVGDEDMGLFELANSKGFDQYYNYIMKDPALKRSNFLESPRNYQLPMDWMVTDPLKAWKHYSTDVGYRLHAMDHGIFREGDFRQNYLTPMETAMKNTGFSESQIGKVISRTEDIFQNQWGIMSELANKSAEGAERYLKNKRNTAAALNTARNTLYARFTAGFKYLEWFQPLVTSMQMTSGRAAKEAFGFGDDAVGYGGIQQLENILRDLNVIKAKDKSFRFDQHALDPSAQNGTSLDYIQRGSQKMADTISDFSIEKMMLGFMGADPGSHGRAFRLFTDSFQGVNSLHTSHNSYMFMAEASHYARIAKEMQDAGHRAADGTFEASDGKSYNWSEVYRKLENLGISRTRDVVDESGSNMKEVDYFIKHENELQNFMGRLKNNDDVSINDFRPKYADIVENMFHHATESYHGTNKAMRPERWNSQLGRTMSMYASFSFNVGMQVVKRRMLDPMDDWITRYSGEGREISKIQMPLLMKHIRQGNEEALRNLGVSDPKRAIAEFPIDAVSTMWRTMSGVGFSIATYTTLDVMRDLYAAPVNGALGEEQFQRTRERFNGIINPHAPQDQQVSLSEVFGGEADAQDMMKFLAWSAGFVAQSGYGGMYASPFESANRYGYGGLASNIPVTGIADRFVNDAVSTMKPVGTLNFDELPPEMLKFGINNLPVIGSSVFTEARQSARDKINEYQQSLDE